MTRAIVEALEKVQNLAEEKKTAEGERSADEQDKDDEVSQREVNAVEGKLNANIASKSNESHIKVDGEKDSDNQEPQLSNPQIGNPISHGQVIDIWMNLKASNLSPTSLDTLLRGSRVYAPPPKPKPEPVSQTL